MKLSERKLYYLYRCLLAEWFTRPTVVTVGKPTAVEIQALKEGGLLTIKGGTTRLTEAGKAELVIAGIDTRSARAAEASWAARGDVQKGVEDEKFDCGHRVGGAKLTYCVGCIERIVARAEKAEKALLEIQASLSDLVAQHEALLKKMPPVPEEDEDIL